MAIENEKEIEKEFGSLKLVKKTRKPFTCRECGDNFPAGESAYNQNDYRKNKTFPKATKVCIDCGKTLIENGTKIKEKEKVGKKEKPIEIIGCGKETIYPKPDGKTIWMCGEKAPVIGVVLCEECGGLGNE